MQRGLAPIFILVGLGFLFLLAVVVYRVFTIDSINTIGGDPDLSEKKVCTAEAMICPDGSGVGRTGPNCEFAPCPSAKPSASPSQFWREKVSINLPKTWVVKDNAILEKEEIVAKVRPDTKICSNESQDVNTISTEKKNLNGLPFTVVIIRDDDGNGFFLAAGYCITQANNSFTIIFYSDDNPSHKLTTADERLFDQIAGSIKFNESTP